MLKLQSCCSALLLCKHDRLVELMQPAAAFTCLALLSCSHILQQCCCWAVIAATSMSFLLVLTLSLSGSA
jgi:hypothetical protein